MGVGNYRVGWDMRTRLSKIIFAALGVLIISFLSYSILKERYGYKDPRAVYSPDEMQSLIQDAAGGDTSASWKLYIYYRFVEYSPVKMEKWLLVGANAGDVRSIYALSLFYVSSDLPNPNFEKSLYWANEMLKYDVEKHDELEREIILLQDRQKNNSRAR